MIKEVLKKAAKLNEFDRRVLMIYSDISLETGARIAVETAQAKAIYKNKVLKV